ncbi:heterokaryon incompatibility protein [Colletotrichum asianum]|uniref:Heterokaryon incompatibility protein n=1 Tax=Colletotrichum asianum TaxID=702518 RepID=A0A8H3ZXA7_9PEZI|nr:heterokaryon incompatibility protein [Colletotrichum asianum]
MLAKQWISHCNHDDHICIERYTSEQPHQSENPTRLLQIDRNARRVRLIQTIRGERYEYVTLSHRWGHKKTASTRKENVHSHVHRGIQTLDLPATFRDAVIVAHTIGYQYLWIDSLCIVQDDTEDWELECPRMASIYQGSVLTIAGTAAIDSHSGLLREQVPDHSSVLQGRGWIFQEGLLSRRTLNFAPGQMYMVCHQGARYETSLYQGVFPHPRWETDFGYYRWWRGTVAKYSSCQFTTIMGRLPALSGIANRFKPPEPDQYLAGIWRHDILRSLLWRRRGKPHSDAPAEYLGPSWSWVSVPARIEFIYVEDGSTSVSCASLVSAATVPKESMPTEELPVERY